MSGETEIAKLDMSGEAAEKLAEFIRDQQEDVARDSNEWPVVYVFARMPNDILYNVSTARFCEEVLTDGSKVSKVYNLYLDLEA